MKTNWIEVFDLIASEYGYTMDQFKAMTLRQLNGCLEMIDIRTHNEFALNASIHGHKVELKKVMRQVEELSDKMKEEMERIHREAIERKVAEKREKR